MIAGGRKAAPAVGHSRLRAMVLGGVSRTLLSSMTMPPSWRIEACRACDTPWAYSPHSWGCLMTNCLLADIGGTEAPFAVLSGSRLEPIHALQVGMYRDPRKPSDTS